MPKIILWTSIAVGVLAIGGALWAWQQTPSQTHTANSVASNVNTVNQNTTVTNSQTNVASNENVNTNTTSTSSVKIYLVGVDDGGKLGKLIGCNDSVVAVNRTVSATNDTLTASLAQLLSYRSGEQNLYTALGDSDLLIDSASVVNGKATVKLSGSYQLGGECDGPRFVEQIKQTVLGVSGVTSADITINGKPLDDVASLKG